MAFLLLLSATASAAEPPDAAPVGGQFLTRWHGSRLDAVDAPPALFLLSAEMLSTPRYAWQVAAVGRDLWDELAAVLDFACADGCGATVSAARDAVATLDHEAIPAAARTAFFPNREEAGGSERRRITQRYVAGRLRAEYVCDCVSQYSGMRHYEDRVTCTLILERDGKKIVDYQPRQLSQRDQHGMSEPAQRWQQTATFRDGAIVVDSDESGTRVTKSGALSKPLH